MTGRDRILNRISDRSVAMPTQEAPSPFVGGDLWAQFSERLAELGGRVIDRAELEALAARKVWVEAAVPGFKTSAETLWDAEVGFSKGEFAVAETGSVAVVSGDGRERLSSLVPPVNVLFVSRIVGSLAEALASLPPRNVAFITGPSRTADIEGVLVRGVHGPGQLFVFIEHEVATPSSAALQGGA